MLIKCPECGLQVSDKAPYCPHCGIAIAGEKNKQRKKRLRLPNGFGRITKINNKNLRMPYRASVTVGKDTTGRPIAKLLKPQAYFRTYNEAYEALVEYHQNPCSLDSGIKVKELYEKWSEQHFKKISGKAANSLAAAWRYCSAVYDMRASDIRARHVRSCMEEGYVIYGDEKRYATPDTKSRIKSLWNLMLDYAVEYELVSQNYARAINMRTEGYTTAQEAAKRGHMSFSAEEMKKLWENIEFPFVKALLIQCYSGWRPKELVELRLENIDLKRWSFVGGSKTTAGINRTVPIHSCVRDFVRELYDDANKKGSKCLLGGISYYSYYDHFKNIVNVLALNPGHRPHDARKQFVTMAKEAGVDEYAIKRIVGHAISDITEEVYTDRSLEWLSSEIEKIKPQKEVY